MSTALIWSAAVRRLIDSHQFAEKQLAFVALFLCVNNMRDLTAGRGSVSADEVAAADCPLDADELDRQCERLRVIRDGILHLSGNVTVSWSTGAPPLTIGTCRRHGGVLGQRIGPDAGAVRESSVRRSIGP